MVIIHKTYINIIKLTSYIRLSSKTLSEKIKLVTIENQWFTKIIKQMNEHKLKNKKTKFRFKNGNKNINLRNFESSSKRDINSDFDIIFDKNDFSTEDVIYQLSEENFMKELRYFTVIDKYDTITLSCKILLEENIKDSLKEYVNTFSKEQAFHYPK